MLTLLIPVWPCRARKPRICFAGTLSWMRRLSSWRSGCGSWAILLRRRLNADCGLRPFGSSFGWDAREEKQVGDGRVERGVCEDLFIFFMFNLVSKRLIKCLKP